MLGVGVTVGVGPHQCLVAVLAWEQLSRPLLQWLRASAALGSTVLWRSSSTDCTFSSRAETHTHTHTHTSINFC